MDEEQELAPVRELGPSRSDLDALKDGAAPSRRDARDRR